MKNIEVVSATGNIKYAVNSNTYKVSTPGSIIKITLPKETISGAQKVKNDLMLMKFDGETIILEDFFAFAGKDENKLVIEDHDQLYLATYDSNNFAGLDFVSIESLNDVMAIAESNGASEWTVPLLGLAAVAAAGIGIAVYNNNNSGSSSHKNPGSGSDTGNADAEKEALKSAQDVLNARSSDLNAALEHLNYTVQAMKANPDAVSIGAVNDARASLDNAANSLKAAKEQLQTAIENAENKGVDTSTAKQVIQQAENSLSGVSEAMTSAEQLTLIAQELLDAYPQSTVTSLQEAIVGVQSTIDKAVTRPVDENIAASKLSKEQAEQLLAELNTIIGNFKQTIEKAQEVGINVSQSTELLNNIQMQYGQASNAIAEAFATALKNQQDLALANDAANAAREAVTAAEQAKDLAKEKLNAALELKLQVLEKNQVDRVDDVNLAIVEANKALETARELAEVANSLILVSSEAVGKVSAEVDADLIPGNISSVDVSELAAIGKGLQVDTHKTFMEALQDFTQKFVDSIKDIYQQIADSKPVTIIQTIISDVFGTFNGISEVIVGKVSAVVESFKIAFKGVVDVASAEFTFFSELFGTAVATVKDTIFGTLEVIKDGIGAVVSGITLGISDALKDMTLLDWVNPIAWVELAKDVIFNSISNIFINLFDVVKEIPGKFIESVMDKIANVSGSLGDKFSEQFDIVKGSVSDILETVFDAFIQAPLEKLIQPIMDKVIELISNPFESIQWLISAIVESVSDGIEIVKSIVSLPGKLLDNTIAFVKDVIDSFNKDTVIDGDGKELQDLFEVTMIKSLLTSADNSGDISLDKIVPQQEKVASVTTTENIVALQIETFHMPISTEESSISAISVAA